jgi:transcriptional regulator with XRE-family HTH domain
MEIVLDKNLKKLLQKKGITAAQLARDTKIAPQTLNNWLSGYEPRSLLQLRRVADYFEVSVDYLAYGISPSRSAIQEFNEEINAGVFEVVLRRVKR